MRRLLCTWTLLFVATVVVVTAQAPGDENELCTVILPSIGVNVIVYPPNVKPLMDSSHYEDLLPPAANFDPPVWQQVDNDNNNPSGLATSWFEQAGEFCETVVTVCGYSAGMQDNWLITQFINRTVDGVRLPQVRVQFEYQQPDCPQNVAQGFSCQRTFGVHKYERSSVDPAAARVTSNYVLVNRLTTRDTVAGQADQNETQNIDFTTNNSGFYLGVRDQSTCILISRLLVYYHVCPSETISLVIRPETIAPSIGSGMQLEVTASCVANAQPRSGTSAKLFCGERGVWFQPSLVGCVCGDGYIESEDGQSCVIAPTEVVPTSHTSSVPPSPTMPMTCPTCPTSPISCPNVQGIRFMLHGRTYLNNTIVLMGDIGEGENALHCVTESTDCCHSITSVRAEFYYPNNSLVSFKASGDLLYRNRGPQVVRLNRRNDVLSPTGRYRCEIPDSTGMIQNSYINIIAPSCMNSGEVFSSCASPCQPTCGNTSPSCPTTCQLGCRCPNGQVLDAVHSRCINIEQCENATFELNGVQYPNASVVQLSDIGEHGMAVIFRTNFEECCREQRLGDCYYPNGNQVGVRVKGDEFYRNRGEQLLRLNRRSRDGFHPTGLYCCDVPTDTSTQRVCVNIQV